MTTPTSPNPNHAEKAREYLDSAYQTMNKTLAREFNAAAQVHATLALVEQQRLANLIALATITVGPLSEQVAGDARHALAEFIDHDDEDLGGWLELRPTIAARLDLTQDVTS